MAAPYPKELQALIVQDAQAVGTCKAAKLHGVSAQTVVRYLHTAGISLKRVGAQQQQCIVCGKTFAARPGTYRECCSLTCRKQITNKTLDCGYCGKEFTVKLSHERKYCSHGCYAMASRKTVAEKKRRGSNWNTIRRRFKSNPTCCLMCKTALAVDLHHILPYKYFKGDYERANNPQNLAPLCQPCHVKAERYVRKVVAVVEHFSEDS